MYMYKYVYNVHTSCMYFDMYMYMYNVYTTHMNLRARMYSCTYTCVHVDCTRQAVPVYIVYRHSKYAHAVPVNMVVCEYNMLTFLLRNQQRPWGS